MLSSLACRDIYLALLDKCSAEEVQYLDCDLLPGCAGGKAERADVDACIAAIAATGDCNAARDVQCAIAVDECSAVPDVFDPAIGKPAACRSLKDAFAAATPACTVTDADCDTVLGTDVNCAFAGADLDALVAQAIAAGQDCETRRQVLSDGASSVRRKFCAPPREATAP